jgi:ATP dependent DNA ligase domain
MKRTSGFIEPCLPSLADRPPSGSGRIHEIKHDGFRLMACRDAAGIRLLTRNGNDFTSRCPLIVASLKALPVRSCVIDGEAVACNGEGLSIFEKLRVTSRAVDLIWLGLALPLRMVIGKAVGRGGHEQVSPRRIADPDLLTSFTWPWPTLLNTKPRCSQPEPVRWHHPVTAQKNPAEGPGAKGFTVCQAATVLPHLRRRKHR